MAKAKITTKWLKENYDCIGFGYCELQYLFYFQDKTFYTCGVYGWNYDVYIIGDYAVCTGYRGMPTNCKVSKEYRHIAREYDDKARKILKNDYATAKDRINYLVDEFMKAITE